MEMDSLTKNRKSIEDIDKMARTAFGGVGLSGADNAVTELKEGWFNVAYNIKLSDGRETILKIAPPKDAEILTYEKSIMATEVDMMRLVKLKTGVSVPEVYFYDGSRELCDADFFFMEKLRGSNYGNIRHSLDGETNRSIRRQKGKCLYMMNQLEGSFFGYEGNTDLRSGSWRTAFDKMLDSVLNDGMRKHVDIGCSYDEIRSLTQAHLHCLDSVTTPRFVHWDAWDHNIFVENEVITGFIDFERALWGDYLIESVFRTLNPDELEGYGKTEFSYEESIRNKLYDIYLYLIAVIECEYRHYDTDENYSRSKAMLDMTVKWLLAL